VLVFIFFVLIKLEKCIIMTVRWKNKTFSLLRKSFISKIYTKFIYNKKKCYHFANYTQFRSYLGIPKCCPDSLYNLWLEHLNLGFDFLRKMTYQHIIVIFVDLTWIWKKYRCHIGFNSEFLSSYMIWATHLS
jgi:hypothetical protein